MQEALSGLAVDYGIVSKKATKVQIKESVLNVAVQLLEHVTYIHTYIYIYIYIYIFAAYICMCRIGPTRNVACIGHWLPMFTGGFPKTQGRGLDRV